MGKMNRIYMTNGLLIRVVYFVCGFIIGAALFSPANAQGLSQFGLWDDDPVAIEQWNYDVRPAAPMVPRIVNPGPRIEVIPEEPEIVAFPNDEVPGTVVIIQELRRLYYVIDAKTALEYPIGVGRDGFQWKGVEEVSRIVEWPEWIPPPEMRQRRPELPVRMAGGVNNPLGAVAMYLGNSLYRIHGSNEPKTIGTESSSGCFRMHNEHAVHLASLVRVGTVVKVY
jgi:lipoprotein-anchoring transpeptidase ErfK/SrfK